MRTLAAWCVGLALTGSAIACTPATYGLGNDDVGDGPADELESDSGELGDGDGDGDGDGETTGDGDGDGDGDGETTGDGDGDGDEGPAQSCSEPQDAGVAIELYGEFLEAEDCHELAFVARVKDVSGNSHTIAACACDVECEGQELKLDITLPDDTWLPGFEGGECAFFYVYAEEVEPGVCRRNRLDIAWSSEEDPWYSVGSASEDLNEKGLKIAPVLADDCSDDCGDWQLRNVTFVSNGSQKTLAWGEVATVGNFFKTVNWSSYVAPDGCGSPGVDITAWTAHQ